MLLSLAKYSTKKIVKDKLPLNINATSNAKNVSIYLYKKYFNLKLKNLENIKNNLPKKYILKKLEINTNMSYIPNHYKFRHNSIYE